MVYDETPRGEGGYQFQKHRGEPVHSGQTHEYNRVDRTNSLVSHVPHRTHCHSHRRHRRTRRARPSLPVSLVPRIQMTPQLGEPSSMQADTRFSIIPRTDDANARGEVLCRYSCTRRAKGPRSAARASSPPDGSRAARVDPAPSRAPHAGSNHAARARRRRSTPIFSPERRARAVPVDLGSLE